MGKFRSKIYNLKGSLIRWIYGLPRDVRSQSPFSAHLIQRNIVWPQRKYALSDSEFGPQHRLMRNARKFLVPIGVKKKDKLAIAYRLESFSSHYLAACGCAAILEQSQTPNRMPR